MKLILQNSYMHLVLNQADLNRFRQHHEVEESVRLGESFGDKLVYAIRTNHSYEQLQIRYIANELQILLPKALAHELLYTELTSFERRLEVGEGRILDLKVSKDPMDIAENFLESQIAEKMSEDASLSEE